MTIKGSKEELIEILNFIKDKVIVTGSYAEGRQTAEKDKWLGLVCLKGDTEANQFAKTKYYSCSGNI